MFATILPLGIIFWAIIILSVVFLAYLIETDHVGGAAIFTLLLFGGFFYFMEAVSFQDIKNNGANIIYYFLMYTGIGIVYCFVKWIFFLKYSRSEYDEIKSKFIWQAELNVHGRLDAEAMHKLNIRLIPDPLKSAFKRYIEEHLYRGSRSSRYDSNGVIPIVTGNKDRIIGWVFWWPISLIISLFQDITRWVYELIKEKLQKLSDYYFRDVKNDFQ